MNWSIITSDITATAGDAYFCNGSSIVNITLPTSANLGDTFFVYSLNDAGWNIVQASGQQIRSTRFLSTLGTTGGMYSNNTTDSATFVYSNGIWEVTTSVGSPTVF